MAGATARAKRRRGRWRGERRHGPLLGRGASRRRRHWDLGPLVRPATSFRKNGHRARSVRRSDRKTEPLRFHYRTTSSGPVRRTGSQRLTVRGIVFPISDWPREQRQQRVAQIIEAMRLSQLSDRRPANLSGARRWVALGRAVAPHPARLLLDEPAVNLGSEPRPRVREDLRWAVAEPGPTILLVRQDVTETERFPRVIRLVQRTGRFTVAVAWLLYCRCLAKRGWLYTVAKQEGEAARPARQSTGGNHGTGKTGIYWDTHGFLDRRGPRRANTVRRHDLPHAGAFRRKSLGHRPRRVPYRSAPARRARASGSFGRRSIAASTSSITAGITAAAPARCGWATPCGTVIGRRPS